MYLQTTIKIRDGPEPSRIFPKSLVLHQRKFLIRIAIGMFEFNPSVGNDEHCSSWGKHHLSWNDIHHSSCCTISLIRLYLDNILSKCNRAALRLFAKELPLFRFGRELLEIISSFFLCSRILGIVWITTTACHAARFHSFVYIATT